ncbi:MAG: LytS/YhcK type 5TM receptor domain-containing protein [Clostridia bacterium]
MKKVVGTVFIVLCIIVSVILQANIFNEICIFGVRANLLLVLTVAIGLWYGIFVGGIYGLINGIIANSLFEPSGGKYIVAYTLIGIVIGLINQIYKKENKAALIYVVAYTSVIFEIFNFLWTAATIKVFAGIFTIIKTVGIATIMNCIIAYIAYYAVVYISYKIDEVLALEDRW